MNDCYLRKVCPYIRIKNKAPQPHYSVDRITIRSLPKMDSGMDVDVEFPSRILDSLPHYNGYLFLVDLKVCRHDQY